MHAILNKREHLYEQSDAIEPAYGVEMTDRAEHMTMLAMLDIDIMQIPYIWHKNW